MLIKNVDEIKDAATIEQVLGLFSYKVNRKNRTKCPVHVGESSMNFKVTQKTGTCFSACGGQHWNPVELLMEVSGADFPTAIRQLAELNNIEVQYSDSVKAREFKVKSDERAALISYNRAYAGKAYSNNPNLNKEGKTVFGKNEYSLETMKAFGLGQTDASNVALEIAKTLNISVEQLKKYGFIDRIGRDKFACRLIFPIIDHFGKVVGFTARRTLKDKSPKYINTSDSVAYKKGRLLYGLHQNKKEIISKGYSLMFEGNTDVITLYENGVRNAFALSGTSFSKEQAKLIGRFSERVIIVLDGDDAGRKALKNVVINGIKEGLVMECVNLEQGYDPDKFVNEYGVDAFNSLIEGESQDAVMHLVFREYNNNDVASKKAAMDMAIDVLKAIQNQPVVFDHYLAKFSETLPERGLKIAFNIPIEADKNIDSAEQYKGLYSHEAEFEFISTLLKDETLVDYFFTRSMQKITSTYFVHEKHSEVFEVIEMLYSAGQPVTPQTVAHKLENKYTRTEIDEYVANDVVASAENMKSTAFVINDFKARRAVADAASMGMKLAYQKKEDVVNSILSMSAAVEKAGEYSEAKKEKTFSESLAEMTQDLHDLIEKRREAIASGEKFAISGVSTGIRQVDFTTQGYQNTDLIIVAARPGMGKTAYVLLNALTAVKKGIPVQIYSLEMGRKQLISRLVAMISQVDASKFRSGDFKGEELDRVIAAIEELESLSDLIHINDKAGISIIEMVRDIRRSVKVNGVGMVIVDYIQLMGGQASTQRTQVVSDISRKLKVAAKDNNIPLIALSQLSRAVEMRGGTKKPQLSDLRESGSIEQDADVVKFIYRPEYYNILEDEEGNSLKGIAEIIIAKNRHGALKSIKARFVANTVTFCDVEESSISQESATQPMRFQDNPLWQQPLDETPVVGVQSELFPSNTEKDNNDNNEQQQGSAFTFNETPMPISNTRNINDNRGRKIDDVLF